MKKLIYSSIAFLLLVGIGACDLNKSGDLGVRSADKEYMALLTKEMDSAGIKYEVDNEGFVMYSSADKERFESVQSKIDKIACAGCKDKTKR